jgi:tetratricopeptide (TPR) repeat protein
MSRTRSQSFLLLSASFLFLLAFLSSCAGSKARQAEAEGGAPRLPRQSIQDHIEEGNPEAALSEYRSYLQRLEGSSRSLEDRLLLARLLLAAGYFEEAREQLEQLLVDSPGSVEVLLALAYLERAAGCPDREKQHLQAALVIDENNPEALASLGTLALEEEDFEQAGRYFRSALEADPRHPAALRGLGLVLLQEECYEEAVRSFDEALAVDPENPLTYADRARAKTASKDRRGAVADLSEAIRLDPDFFWHYVDRGRLYLRLGELEQAHQDFSRAIYLDPENFLPYVYRAGLNDRLDRSEQAILDYERLLELNPKYTFAYASLAVLYYIGQDWQKAAGAFRKAFEFQREEGSYALLATLCLKQQGRNREAELYLEEQLACFPEGSWIREIARYLLNPALEAAVVNRASRESNKLIQARMLFYIASQMLLENRSETAIRYLLIVKQIERRDSLEKRIAACLLERYEVRD